MPLNFGFFSEELIRFHSLLERDRVTVEDLVEAYNLYMRNIEIEANDERHSRQPAGIIRASKGWLVESIAKHMVVIAWRELGKDENRLVISQEKISVPIARGHLERLPEAVRQHIQTNIQDFVYKCKVDVHVMVDNELAMAIECKSYTENAMIKRILVDFMLLKTKYPDLRCVLMQLESQLGGDYSNLDRDIVIGSKSTRTLESHFPSVNLNIITLLQGERRVNRPIHEPDHFKGLDQCLLQKAIENLKEILSPF